MRPQAVAKPLYSRASGWRRREGQGAGASGWVVGGEAARGGGGAVTCVGGGEAASPPGSDQSPAEWLRPERTLSRTERVNVDRRFGRTQGTGGQDQAEASAAGGQQSGTEDAKGR